MGYTHYFTISNKTKPAKIAEFIENARKIITAFDGKICDGLGEKEGAEISTDSIRLNGFADEGHETFQIEFNSGKGDFCKTAQKPYDAVVVALLIVGKKLGVITSWSSDGDKQSGDFDDAEELIKKAIDKS